MEAARGTLLLHVHLEELDLTVAAGRGQRRAVRGEGGVQDVTISNLQIQIRVTVRVGYSRPTSSMASRPLSTSCGESGPDPCASATMSSDQTSARPA